MTKKRIEDMARPRSKPASPNGFLARISPKRPVERDEEDDMEGDDVEEVEIQHKRAPAPRVVRRVPASSGPARPWGRIGIWIAGVLLVAGGTYYLSTMLARAQVQVQPKVEKVEVDAPFTAVLGGTEGSIHFEVMDLSATDSVSIPATGKETVEKKAGGVVVLYNAFSSQPQNLVATTRVRSTNGKVFRIPQAVTIPGAKTEKGVLVPGSIEVTVQADGTGPDYNIPLSDFTIPGFEGTPKYTKFYGRSKTAMTGGTSGTINVAPKEAVDAAKEDIKQKLTTRLSEEALKDIPEGFVGYSTGLVSTFEEIAPTAAGTSTDVVVGGRATVRGIVLKSSELAQAIAKTSLGREEITPVEIPEISQFTFELLDKNVDFKTATSIRFQLKGAGKVVATYDEVALKKALAGISLADSASVFKDFPMLESVRPVISPPWIQTIPADTARITIERVIQ